MGFASRVWVYNDDMCDEDTVFVDANPKDGSPRRLTSEEVGKLSHVYIS